MPKSKTYRRGGVGMDNIDVDYARDKGTCHNTLVLALPLLLN